MRTVEKHGAGGPGGTVENVQTFSMMSDASFKLPSKTDERKERLANGQCPSCGQQLYQLKPVEEACCLAQCFGKVVVQDTDGKGQQQLIKKVPLNIPQLVDRGQCVNCMHLSRVSDATCTTISEDDPTNIFPHPLSPLPSMNESMDRDAAVKSKMSPKKHSSPTTSLEMIKNDLKGLAPPPFSVPGAVPVTPGVQRIPASPRRPVSSPSTAVYTGEYNDFGEKHGQGKLQWGNGDSYQGTFVKDKRQGQGTLTFASGGEYVGEWFNNQMHGEGTRRYPNADIYVGSYVQGKREGEGRFYYANGDLFWGDWKNNHMEGPGRYYYNSGQRFEGTFHLSQRLGVGKMQRSDGSMEVFPYFGDEKTGPGVRWSADRTQAWRLCCEATNGGAVVEKTSLSIAEAVAMVDEMEVSSTAFLDGVVP